MAEPPLRRTRTAEGFPLTFLNDSVVLRFVQKQTARGDLGKPLLH